MSMIAWITLLSASRAEVIFAIAWFPNVRAGAISIVVEASGSNEIKVSIEVDAVAISVSAVLSKPDARVISVPLAVSFLMRELILVSICMRFPSAVSICLTTPAFIVSNSAKVTCEGVLFSVELPVSVDEAMSLVCEAL